MKRFPSLFRKRTETLFGTWVKLTSLETVEMLAAAKFDFIVVDLEHSFLSLESAHRAIVVAQALGLGALVRVPDYGGSDTQRILDAGADGILVPRVSNADTARNALAGMIFEPLGRRGMGVTSRAGRWGADGTENYLAEGNGVLRILQIEDRAGIENLNSILTLNHLDAIFIGTGDLALSTGLAPTDPELRLLVDAAMKQCRAHGIPCGTAVATVDAAEDSADRGFEFVMVSNDASIFASAAINIGKSLRTRAQTQDGTTSGSTAKSHK